MASFEEIVLALGPVFFGRLDELSGSVITDISGFDNHGVYHPAVAHGQSSPVETDPASYAAAGNIGYVSAPSGSQLDLRQNFTLIGFTHHDPEFAGETLWARNGQVSLNGSNLLMVNEGRLRAMLSSGPNSGDTHNLFDPEVLVPFVDYFAALTRNENVISLWKNAEIVDEDDTFPTGEIVYEAYNGSSWKIAASFNGTGVSETFGGVWTGSRTDEVILFDYALTAEQILAIYESAINATLLRAVSNVIPTATLDGRLDSTPISFPFRHNWSEPLIERISFRTSVSRARTGKEEAIAQRPIPRRELEFVQLLRNNHERRKLRASLWKSQDGVWFVPVRQDAEQLPSALTAGTTTIPISPTYKDYEIGGWVGLRQLDDSGNILHWEERIITGLNGGVECEALENDYTARLSWVYPVRRARVDASLTARGHTDAVEDVRLSFRLLPEDEAISPNRLTIWHPTIKYRDYEVYDPSIWPSHSWNDEREYDIVRQMDEVDFNVGVTNWEADTSGAAEAIPMRLHLEGRAQIAQFLGWFYERQGQLRYLWVPTMQADFDILSYHIFEHQITVRDTNYSDAYALAEPRRDLALIYNDNTMKFRRVIAFEGSVNETLTLDAPLPSFTNLRCVSLLKFCRLDADQIELAWQTDSVVVVEFKFRELLHPPEGVGRSSLSPSASLSLSPSPSGSASPSASVSLSTSPSASRSPSASTSPSSSLSPSSSPSATLSPSSSVSRSPSPSASQSPSSSSSPSS